LGTCWIQLRFPYQSPDRKAGIVYSPVLMEPGCLREQIVLAWQCVAPVLPGPSRTDQSMTKPVTSLDGQQASRRMRYEQLLKPELDALYRTARRILGDPDQASDCVQDACLKAYEHFDSFEVGTNFRAWIFRILRNTALDVMRRNRRAPFVPISIEEFTELVDASPGPLAQRSQPEIEHVRKTFVVDAAQAFARLPDDIRMVVSLALLEEMSYAEISVIMDCPIGTVRSRLNRGRQRLQEMLSAYTTEANTSNVTSIDMVRFGNGPIH
jgi:RNA polymerase sigma-70 factor (ECF subfamily)